MGKRASTGRAALEAAVSTALHHLANENSKTGSRCRSLVNLRGINFTASTRNASLPRAPEVLSGRPRPPLCRSAAEDLEVRTPRLGLELRCALSADFVEQSAHPVVANCLGQWCSQSEIDSAPSEIPRSGVGGMPTQNQPRYISTSFF